ncbi:MAG TPA: MFS transporter [Acidimicrobiia bacterium]
MTLPARVIQAVRPHASPGVMAGAAVVAATFAATPFLLPDLSTRMGMDIGNTGFLSTAQVGSFAFSTFLAGRLLRPRRRLHYGSLGLIALATAASALVTTFPLLLVTRVVAGLGMGTLTWIAWADATRSPRGMGDVAAIAPVTATIASPVLGWITGAGGYPWVFGSLAALALLAALAPVDFGDLPRIGRNVSGSRSNRLLLIGLLVLSVGGSSVFIFTGAAAEAVHGLSPVTVSWALSLNAICGVIATRRNATRGTAALWIGLTAASAIAVGVIASPIVFFIALAVWGFAFWMAIPEVLKMLTERSLSPSERMGDAQAAMAVGRVFGPVVGAFALGAGLYTRLSLVGAALMTCAAVVIGAVELYRLRSSEPVSRGR